ncbi:aminopeptidase N-like [Microplitis mediator]|uniref:aminopeptidase N-like n=1 Tax=Microplitis mediator TaxID=375433 RepID=UPI00255332C0|nr:aminopeptidase N-like [Microplitis mediator]
MKVSNCSLLKTIERLILKQSAGVMITILIYGILIPSAVFCNSADTQICSVYKTVDINNSNNALNSISEPKSYVFSSNGELSMDIEIKYECDTLIFNPENLDKLDLIHLKSVDSINSYTTNVYLINKKGLLQITFPHNLPRGNYSLYLKYNRGENNSPNATLHQWIALTNFDDNNFDKPNNHAIRIWIRKNALGHGKYLMENIENLMKAFENYTGVSYKEKKHVKFDFIVLPNFYKSKYNDGDFIYVDEELFVEEEYTATVGNERLFRGIAKLMINDAFKNYNPSLRRKYGVLMRTLKEYLSYHITDEALKTWNLMDLYAYRQRYGIFEDDYIYSRKKFEDENTHPNRGFLIRMLEHAVGENNFKNAIQGYLQNSEEIRNTNVFFKMIDMSKDKNKTLDYALKSWMDKIKLAILTINRDYNSNKAIITQSQFSKRKDADLAAKYWIPMNFASESDADFINTTVTDWYNPESASVEIPAPPPYNWLIVNKQQFGYYRVNYDEENWKLIIQYLKLNDYHKIHVLNRAQLIDDAFVLAEFGYLNYSIAFDLARYISLETEYVPWATFWEKMFRLFQYSSISNSQYYKNFKKSILVLSESLERTILSDEVSTDNDRMKRLKKISFIKWTCFYGSKSCRNYTLTKLENWLTDPVQHPLLPDIREEMLCAGIRGADQDTWNKLLSKFLINKDNDLLLALMCSSDNQLLQKLMTMFVKGELIDRNPWLFFVGIAQYSTNGVDAILEFIDKHQDLIHKNNDPLNLVEHICIAIEEFINNDDQLEKFAMVLKNYAHYITPEDAHLYLDTASHRVDHANHIVYSFKV